MVSLDDGYGYGCGLADGTDVHMADNGQRYGRSWGGASGAGFVQGIGYGNGENLGYWVADAWEDPKFCEIREDDDDAP